MFYYLTFYDIYLYKKTYCIKKSPKIKVVPFFSKICVIINIRKDDEI